ncbi:MAG TPA: hypothetical protein VLZ83_16140 [Edaphocola sp.]|nr:hypothetical protein [Edaphocola sp.]
MSLKFIKLFLRVTIAVGFLSAVADRFGLWHQNSAWGNWDNFVLYTQQLLPFLVPKLVTITSIVATTFETIFGITLLLGWKTKLFAQLSGFLLLFFGIAMWFSFGIKKPLDFSVFTAAGASFALSTIKVKFLELDSIFK